MVKLGKKVFGVLALSVAIAGAGPANIYSLSSFTTSVAAAKAVTATDILLNDKHIDVGKILQDQGSTYVPLKPLAAAMGYSLSWNAGTKRVELLRPGRRVIVKSGSSGNLINGAASSLSLPPKLTAGTLYVPLVATVQALGGSVRKDEKVIYITDKERYVMASLNASSYWVSQADGALYVRLAGQASPKRLGKLAMSHSPYLHTLTVRSVGLNSQLLELKDKHYAMFNDFENGYQALLQGDTLVQQTAYHYSNSSYNPVPGPSSTQPYLTDGASVQYILADGSLGMKLHLKGITGHDLEGSFRVEYAAPDVLLVRPLSTTRLYAINPSSGEAINLSAELIEEADSQEWNRADGSDPNVLNLMLTLTKREGNVLTFVYTPLFGGAAKKKTYTVTTMKPASTVN